MATTIVSTGTLGNMPNATGQSNQSHLVYGVNSARWFLFAILAGDTTHINCYVSSSNDLSTATWATIGTGTQSPVLSNSDTWTANEARNLATTYQNIAATDVVYIVGGTSATAIGSALVQGIRATLTASVATWGAWSSLVATSATANTPEGSAAVVNTLNRAWFLNSRLTADRDTAGVIATNVDAGTSWTAAWGAATGLDNSQANTVNSGALAPLASGLVLGVVDNGAVTATTTNHVFRKSSSATAWPASSAWSVITATTIAAADKNDWALCGVTTTDVHFVRRVTSTTFAHYRYDGTSWGSVINPAALTAGGGTAHLAASGIHLATDGASLWCFWIDTDANHSIRYAQWTAGSGWDAAWSTLSISDTTAKNFISGSQQAGNSQIGVIWTENASTPFAIVTAPLSLNVVNPNPTASDSAALGDAPPFNVSLGGQYAFEQPTADLSAGLWAPSAGGTLFGMLDESTPDASTFDTSSTSPASDTFEVSLGNAPVAIDLNGMPGVLNYQYRGTVTGGRRVDLTVVLLCNSTPVQTWTLPAIQSTFLIAPLQLSSAGLAAIVPGGALSLRTTATQI